MTLRIFPTVRDEFLAEFETSAWCPMPEAMKFSDAIYRVHHHAEPGEPYFVIGVTDPSKGGVMIHFLEQPDAATATRILVRVSEHVAAWLYIESNYRRCVRHDDCIGHAGLGAECFEATERGRA